MKELSDEFSNPHSAFQYGRKVQKSYGLGLAEIEEMANIHLPAKVLDFEGEIKMKIEDEFFDSYLGYFFSGVYHDIMDKGDVITIDLRRFPPGFPHLRYRLGNKWGFGYRHRKGELRIIGYSGGYLGQEMMGGRIEVVGRVSDRTGYRMVDGVIRIIGSCGWRTGDEMRGGRIIIEGDAGEWTGINMYGGEIRVRGEIKSIGKRHGGRIFHWREEWREMF
jgi:formylmethanofuran dehydrogenase subunit C